MPRNKNKNFVAPSNSFASHLYASFRATYGPFFTFAGVALGIIVFFVVPRTSSLPARYAIVIILVAVYLVIWLFEACWSAFKQKSNTLPAVRCSIPAPKAFPQAIGILLLEPSELFSYDSVVAIYLIEHEIERCIGVGKVINIQEDKKIQVLVMRRIEDDGWDGILNNDATKLRCITVKPNFPSFAMEVLK